MQFGLSVDDKFSRQLNGLINYLNKIDSSGRKAQEAIGLIATAIKGWGSQSIAEQGRAFEKLSNQISSLQKEYYKLSAEREKIAGQEEIGLNDLHRIRQLDREMKEAVHQMKAYANMRELLVRAQPDRKSQYQVPFFNANSVKDLQNVYGKAFDTLGERLDKFREKIDALTAKQKQEVAALEAQMKKLSPHLDGKNWAGKNLSARDMAAYKDLQQQMVTLTEDHSMALNRVKIGYDDIERQMTNLVNRSVELQQSAERMANATYKPYVRNDVMENQQRIQQTSTLKHAAIERMDAEKKAAKEAEASARKTAAAIEQEKRARQEAIAVTRQQAEALIRARATMLEGQRTQIADLYSHGKSMGFSKAELSDIRQAYSDISKELMGLRSIMQNLSQYSSGQLFSFGRSTMSYEPFVRANREKQRSIELERQHQQEIAATAARIRNDLARAMEQVNSKAGAMHGVFQDLKSLYLQGGIVYGMKQFADSIIQTGGEIEQQHIALRSILGDVAAADKMFAQTQQLALESPFKFGELNRDVKQLAAFGVEANDLYDTTKRLADIASGLGVSFERLGLAYGQVKARAWLDGKELRQFAYAGLPMLQKITDLYNSEGKNGRNNYTTGDVKKMISAREVSFEDVQKVLWAMTDEGGQFYNMQLVLSETLLGRWNKLIDAWDIMLGKFADGKSIVGDVMKALIDQVTNLVLAMDRLSPALMGLGAAYAGKKALDAIGIGAQLTALQTANTMELRRYALEQQELVVEGKITQQMAMQNVAKRGLMLADEVSTQNAMSRLALEGKLNLLQMQKAFREKLITPELVKQLEVMGLISAKQSELIMKSNRWARAQLAGSQMMGKMSGLFTWGNAAMAGAGLAIGAMLSYFQKREEMAQRTKDITTSAEQHMKSYAEALSGLGNVSTAMPQEIEKANEELKDVLTQSGRYTDTIKEQVEGTASLIGQYKILKEAVEDAKKASGIEDVYADLITKVFSDGGKGFGFSMDNSGPQMGGMPSLTYTESFATNAADMKEALMGVETAMTGLSEKTKATMERVANSFLPAEMATLSLEEKMVELKRRGEYGDFVKKVSSGNQTVKTSLEQMEGDLYKFVRNMNTIGSENVPRMTDVIATALHMNSDDFAKWAQHNVNKVDVMFTKLIELCNINSPVIVKKLREIMFASLNLQDPQGGGGGTTKGWQTGLKVGGAGEYAYNKMRRSGVVGPKLGRGTKFYHKEMAELLSSMDAIDFETFGENVQKQYKTVRNENDARKSAGARRVNQRKQAMLEAIAAANGIDLDVGKNKVTGNFGKDGSNNKDEELERLKKRVELYKKFYSELQKYRDLYGNGALQKMQKDGEFAPVFGYGLEDITNYEKSIRQLVGGIEKSTDARRSFAEQSIGGISSENRKLEEEAIKEGNDALEKRLDLIEEEYDTYKKLMKLTGDKEGSMGVAFGDGIGYSSYKEYLRNQMSGALKSANARTGNKYGVDEVLGMSEADFNKAYGKNSEEVSEIYKRYQAEQIKLQKESIDLMADLIEKNRTIAQQIEDENRNYEHQLELLRAQKNLSPEMREQAEAGAKATHKKNLGDLQFEQFKEQSDWVKVFDDLDNVSSKTILSMIEKINAFSKNTNLSVEAVKSLRDALTKLKDEAIDRNPMDALLNSTKRGNAIGDYLKGGLGAQYRNGEGYVLTKEQAKKTGLTAGKTYSEQELKDAQKESYSDFNKGLDSLQKKFKALQDVLSPVTELFDVLGMEDNPLSEMFSAGSSALGAASTVSSGLSSLGLSSFGPYGAAAGAALSVISSVAAMHDKALQKEIEASERRQKEMENLTENVKTLIEDTLGGIYTYSSSDETKKVLKKVSDNYEKTSAMLAENRAYGLLHGKTYSDDTYKAVKKAQTSGTAYDAEYASLLAQRDELQKQYDLENSKKKKDKDALADYKQELTEMEEQIDTFTQDFLETIYSIDLKSWASELTDAIVDAWASGEDAADAYHDKVQELMKDLSKNIISQSVLELYMEKPLAKMKAMLQQKGKLDATDIIDIAQTLYDSETEAVDTVTGLLDALKEKGLDLSENGSSSVTNSIKSITEETADLLASYVNAIRADVSVNRKNVQLIAAAVSGLPDLNTIAQSQLTQLTQLVMLANVRNERLDAMYDWMRAVTNGTKKVSVS